MSHKAALGLIGDSSKNLPPTLTKMSLQKNFTVKAQPQKYSPRAERSKDVWHSRQIIAKEFSGNPQVVNFLKQYERKLCMLATRKAMMGSFIKQKRA